MRIPWYGASSDTVVRNVGQAERSHAGEEGAVAVTGPGVLRCASVLGLVEGDCDRVVPVEGLGLAVADPAVGADRVGGLNVPRHPRARVGERVPAACRVVAALEIDQDVVPPRY